MREARSAGEGVILGRMIGDGAIRNRAPRTRGVPTTSGRGRRGVAAIAAAAVIAAIAALAVDPGSAGAHGDEGDGPVWTDREVGPYVITLWADLHVPSTVVYARIRVADGDGAPEGTTIDITGEGPEGTTAAIDVARLAGRAGQEGDFEALLPIPLVGEWTVTLHISGPAGEGEASFEGRAKPESSEQWSRTPFLWATLLIVVIAAAGAWRRRGARGERDPR